MAKFAVLSLVLPPSPSGQAVVLYRILSGFKGEDYYLVHSRAHAQNADQENNLFHLPARYYSLPAEPQVTRPEKFGLWRIRSLTNLFLSIYVRAKNLIEILKSEPETTALVACSGDFSDIPAAFLASKVLKLRFYIYIFDDYVFQWIGGYRVVAKLISALIFKHSAGIIGPNEFICEEYQRRYDVATILVRNPCAVEELKRGCHFQWPTESGRIKIVYTGAVYHANFHCFRNLLQAMKALQEYPLELHIFTPQTNEALQRQGILGGKTFVYSHMSYNEILEQQRKADILFLPLAFESEIPEVIRTSAPGKLGEYLASGRPVLAHVPADSFVAYYLKKNQCGLIADQNDPQKLATEIRELINNPERCNEIIQNAQRQARLDFSPELAQEQLKRLLQISDTREKNDGA